jgi:hypothetical protein
MLWRLLHAIAAGSVDAAVNTAEATAGTIAEATAGTAVARGSRAASIKAASIKAAIVAGVGADGGSSNVSMGSVQQDGRTVCGYLPIVEALKCTGGSMDAVRALSRMGWLKLHYRYQAIENSTIENSTTENSTTESSKGGEDAGGTEGEEGEREGSNQEPITDAASLNAMWAASEEERRGREGREGSGASVVSIWPGKLYSIGHQSSAATGPLASPNDEWLVEGVSAHGIDLGLVRGVVMLGLQEAQEEALEEGLEEGQEGGQGGGQGRPQLSPIMKGVAMAALSMGEWDAWAHHAEAWAQWREHRHEQLEAEAGYAAFKRKLEQELPELLQPSAAAGASDSADSATVWFHLFASTEERRAVAERKRRAAAANVAMIEMYSREASLRMYREELQRRQKRLNEEGQELSKMEQLREEEERRRGRGRRGRGRRGGEGLRSFLSLDLHGG